MQVSAAATEPAQGSSSEQGAAQPGSGRWFLASRRQSAARPVWCCVGAPSERESPSARDGEKRGLAEPSHSHGSPAPSSSFWLRPYPCSPRRETDIKWSWIRHHLPWEKYQTAAHCWGWRRVCTTTTQQHSEQLSTALLSPSTALCQLCHITALGSHHQNSTMHLSVEIQLVEKRPLTFPPSRLLGYVRNAKTIDGKCMER